MTLTGCSYVTIITIKCIVIICETSFTYGENLVLAIKICLTMYGDKISETLRSIPVSNDIIKRTIDCKGNRIKYQLLILKLN